MVKESNNVFIGVGKRGPTYFKASKLMKPRLAVFIINNIKRYNRKVMKQ